MTDTDTRELIDKLAAEYGDEKTRRMVTYINKVLERNEYINLTAVRDRNEAMQKHLADSLAVTELPQYRNARRIIDVGTGAGFPGAILAIADPDKEFVLLDSTLKRLKVIDEFANDLGLDNITTVHARAEEISRKPEFREVFDICVSRAVASLDKLSGWCLPFVRKGGYFIPYKGENYEAEVNEAAKSLRKYRGKLEAVISYEAGMDSISGHVLLVIRKN